VNRLLGLIVLSATLLAADIAMAQGPGPVEEIKIGPFIAGQRLRASDVVQLPPLLGHVPPVPGDPGAAPHSGWAGYKFTVHVLDNTEVDVDGVLPYPFLTHSSPIQPPPRDFEIPTTNPFGPRSENQQSITREWHELIPSATQSGVDVPPSHLYRVADLKLHVKGTNNPADNSDVDVQVRLWNIWHFRQGYTSMNVPLRPSDRLWVASPFLDTAQIPPAGPAGTGMLPPPPPVPISEGPGLGAHWLHVQQPRPFHMYGSQFYATLARTFNIGIDHIPEPATAALFGLGAFCAVMGVRSNWRRRSK
jgi:hypothetical protein